MSECSTCGREAIYDETRMALICTGCEKEHVLCDCDGGESDSGLYSAR